MQDICQQLHINSVRELQTLPNNTTTPTKYIPIWITTWKGIITQPAHSLPHIHINPIPPDGYKFAFMRGFMLLDKDDKFVMIILLTDTQMLTDNNWDWKYEQKYVLPSINEISGANQPPMIMQIKHMKFSIIPGDILADAQLRQRFISNSKYITIHRRSEINLYNISQIALPDIGKVILPNSTETQTKLFARFANSANILCHQTKKSVLMRIKKIKYIRSHFTSNRVDNGKIAYAKTWLLDILDNDSIINLINKGYLAEMLQSVPDSPVVRTENMPEKVNFDKPTQFGHSVYIIKIVNTWAGRGNFVVSGNDAANMILTTIPKNVPVSVCEYIANPLLWKLDSGAMVKFHVRANIILTSWNTFSVWPVLQFCPAKKAYKLADFDDVDIHDTHMRTAPRQYAWPLHDDQWGGIDVYRVNYQIKYAFSKLVAKYSGAKDVSTLIDYLDITKKHTQSIATTYPNSKYAYQMLGMDVMFSDDYKPWILEINQHPSLTCKSIDIITGRHDSLYDWEYRVGIYPIFGKDKPKYYFADTPQTITIPDYQKLHIHTQIITGENVDIKTPIDCELVNNQSAVIENAVAKSKRVTKMRPTFAYFGRFGCEWPGEAAGKYLGCECKSRDEFEHVLQIASIHRYKIVVGREYEKIITEFGLRKLENGEWLNDVPDLWKKFN